MSSCMFAVVKMSHDEICDSACVGKYDAIIIRAHSAACRERAEKEIPLS